MLPSDYVLVFAMLRYYIIPTTEEHTNHNSSAEGCIQSSAPYPSKQPIIVCYSDPKLVKQWRPHIMDLRHFCMRVMGSSPVWSFVMSLKS